jgi:hypothetical protein
MWGLWWTKQHWGKFSPSISVSPANHSTNFYITIFIRGWHNMPLVAVVPSGPNWTPPPIYELKKITVESLKNVLCGSTDVTEMYLQLLQVQLIDRLI